MKTYAALATRQLRIHPKLEHAKLLKHELANYQTKTTESGRNIFAAREGEHDDLIMALCLPTLAASLPLYQLIPTPEKAAEVRWQGKIRREMEAMRQEEEAEKTPEQLALEREQSRLEAARQAEEADDVRFGFGWGDDDPPRASWS
jgi:hypothetical protein